MDVNSVHSSPGSEETRSYLCKRNPNPLLFLLFLVRGRVNPVGKLYLGLCGAICPVVVDELIS